MAVPAGIHRGLRPRFARRARSYRGMARVGWRRSNCLAQRIGALFVGWVEPAIPIGPWRWVSLRSTPSYEALCAGGVEAGLVRETRRDVRLSRTRSAPTGEEHRAPRRPVGAGPARESRAGRAPTGGWRGWGSVGADLIRESRQNVRLSRTRSAPTGEGIPCPPATCRSAPCPRNRAQGALLQGNGAGGAA